MEIISKQSNRIENSVITKSSKAHALNSQLDYTNTRFHNALIVRHDHDKVIQEEIEKGRAMKERGAYDLAQDATTSNNIQKA